MALLVAVTGGCLCAEEFFAAKREQMVASQIAARGVSDPAVLEAMRKVERHKMVPSPLAPVAYSDRPLPIGEGQTISQPYIVALMTETLAVKPGQKVLEVGTGSGYQAAVLAELGCEVYTIEIVDVLAKRAAETLKGMGYEKVRVRSGDGYKGWPEAAPFDSIIVTCAPEDIPEPLVDQLAEGGRMCIPVGAQNTVQTLTLVRKKSGQMQTEALIPVSFVPMTRLPEGEPAQRAKRGSGPVAPTSTNRARSSDRASPGSPNDLRPAAPKTPAVSGEAPSPPTSR